MLFPVLELHHYETFAMYATLLCQEEGPVVGFVLVSWTIRNAIHTSGCILEVNTVVITNTDTTYR